MDTIEMRDSGDEQDDQDDQDDPEDREDRDDREEVKNSRNNARETESNNSENCQENRGSTNRTSKTSKQSRNKSRSGTPQNLTRLLNPQQSKRTWKSANAFINFVQDFKKDNYEAVPGRNIFQICGERWKCMSDEQKQPYITAANNVRKLKQRMNSEINDQTTKKSVTRVSKRKAETKRKEASQKRSKANKRDAKSSSDTDTATTTVHSSMSDADSF